jgi:hypothetical protein
MIFVYVFLKEKKGIDKGNLKKNNFCSSGVEFEFQELWENSNFSQGALQKFVHSLSIHSLDRFFSYFLC